MQDWVFRLGIATRTTEKKPGPGGFPFLAISNLQGALKVLYFQKKNQFYQIVAYFNQISLRCLLI